MMPSKCLFPNECTHNIDDIKPGDLVMVHNRYTQGHIEHWGPTGKRDFTAANGKLFTVMCIEGSFKHLVTVNNCAVSFFRENVIKLERV